ncbi:hypothetical protein SNE40_006052 [Patella caerulea]|uniref:Uncharacterized protein n=1 Tax=Patella caerulea TaxID=87958 RepID=A0AAN8Q410_PATCE
MNIFQELIYSLKNIVVAFAVAIFRFFVPPARKSVNDEIVLITGSGNGMGRQLSIEFAKLGAIVVLCDYDKNSNEETQRLIKENGGQCYSYICDVSDRGAVYRMGEQIRKDVGHVTILINNAGIVTGKSLLECPDDLIEKTFNVNLLAQFWTVKCFLPDMLKKNHGHIVNMASSTGLIGINKLTDYSASKFGVVGFTEVLNYEIVFSGYDGVHTTLLCPSFTQTEMFKGCQMRFPWVIPPLKTEETVATIMQSILTNQYEVCIPRLVYIFSVLKTMLPVECMLEIIRFFGAHNFMENYAGRQKPDETITSNGGFKK